MSRPVAPRRPRAGGQRGFTLIEVLVALLVFSVGVLGMVGLQARLSVRSVEAEDRIRAALLADDLIGTMWAERSATVSTVALTKWLTRLTDSKTGLPGSPSYNIASSNGVTTLTLQWQSPGRVNNSGSALPSRYVTSVVIP